jgi:alkylation response protein AidB-like acyl-CoA dehydrogenase
MNFDFDEDQRTIKATARELLLSRSPFKRVRAAAEAGRYDDDLWRELCELGWPGIAVAEEHGGQGLGAVELSVLRPRSSAARSPRSRSSMPATPSSARAGCPGWLPGS